MISRDDAERSVCRLETIGRTSGRPREIEIWFAADGDRIYLLSGGRDDAHWVRNLRVESKVRVRIGRRWLRGVAREIEGEADEVKGRQLLGAKYQGWREGRPLSEWARESLPVRVDLSPEAG
jgi:deazaflavin-dependent oxidoreductase (nitroreductase family)